MKEHVNIIMDVTPINFLVERIIKNLGIYFIIIFAASSIVLRNQLIYIQVFVASTIFLIPLTQLVLWRSDDIYMLAIDDCTISIKWKRFWFYREAQVRVSELDVEVYPFLKGTYRMTIKGRKNGKVVEIVQLSNKIWTIEKMRCFEKQFKECAVLQNC